MNKKERSAKASEGFYLALSTFLATFALLSTTAKTARQPTKDRFLSLLDF